MIDAKELRIGDLLEFEGRIAKVKEIDQQGCVFEFEDKETEWIDLFRMTPIPITEEWLLKFGFEILNCKWYGFGNFRINNSLDVEWANRWMGVRLKYLHQLQNLYFALTGKELEPKE